MASLEGHTSLASIPPEIIGQICTHLKQTSLSRLSKTCKSLCGSAQPALFRSFEFRPCLVSYLRALVARPDLAKLVNSIEMRSPDYGDLKAADQKLIEDCVVSLGAPALPSGWVDFDDPPHRTIVVELIIGLTPNLEVLNIGLDYDWELDILQHLTGTLSLSKLKNLMVYQFYISGDRYEVPMSWVQPLLEAAPNLATLKIPSFNDILRGNSYPIRNLRHLKFEGYCTSASGAVVNMLASCPLLETFTMYWGHDYIDDYEAFNIWRALEQRHDSLRELVLGLRLPGHDWHTEAPVATRPNDLGSLQTFTKLEVVRLYDHALYLLFMAWSRDNPPLLRHSFLLQLLPDSIVEAEFMEPDRLFIPAMLELSRRMTSPFPRLRRLSFAVSPHELAFRRIADGGYGGLFGGFAGISNAPNGWPKVEKELTEGFARQGIEFEVRELEEYYWEK